MAQLSDSPKLKTHCPVFKVHGLGKKVNPNRCLKTMCCSGSEEDLCLRLVAWLNVSADLVCVVKLVIHEPCDDARLAHRLVPQEHLKI